MDTFDSEPQEFEEKIFTMTDQHALHRGLTSHFKVPKKPVWKSSTQFRSSVHQRLGPPVDQEGSNQSFWNKQQNKSQNSNLVSTACIKGGPLPRNPSRRMKGGAKKMAGPSKGAGQWRSVGGARLAVFAQQWQNLLSECRSLHSGVLLKLECHQPPLTRTPIHFPTRNKKQDLHKAVDSPLEKGAIEPVHRNCFLGFFSRLFLVPKETGDLHPVMDLSMLSRHLVMPHSQMEGPNTSQGCSPSGQMDGTYSHKGCLTKKKYLVL